MFYLYLIIDIDNYILDIFVDGIYDFENILVGVSWIWGFFYIGELFVFLGSNVGIDMLSEDCWDFFGNFIMVNWVEVLILGELMVECIVGLDVIFSLVVVLNLVI